MIDPAQSWIELRIERYASKADFEAGKPFNITTDGGPLGDRLLTNAGGNLMWTLITGGGGTAFSLANTWIGVGTSTTAAVATQTDLVASVLRRPCSTGFPTFGTRSATWRSVFDTGDANVSWQEFGVFNAQSAGTMLDRFLSNQGTKPATQVWAANVTISLT